MKEDKTKVIQSSALTPEILTTLHGLNNYHHKLYCFPSQKKILELMKDRLYLERSRSTLNRHLRIMEKSGLIIRKRRIRRDKYIGMVFQSTLYEITLKGYDLLRKLNINVWKQINILRNKLFPKFKPPLPGKEKLRPKGDLTGLKDILGGLKFSGST